MRRISFWSTYGIACVDEWRRRSLDPAAAISARWLTAVVLANERKAAHEARDTVPSGCNAGVGPGSGVAPNESPPLVEAVMKAPPPHHRADLLQPETPGRELQTHAVLLARPPDKLPTASSAEHPRLETCTLCGPSSIPHPSQSPTSGIATVGASGCVRKRRLKRRTVESNIQPDSDSVLEDPEILDRHRKSPLRSPGETSHPYRHGHLVARIENAFDRHVGSSVGRQPFEELLRSVMALKGPTPRQPR